MNGFKYYIVEIFNKQNKRLRTIMADSLKAKGNTIAFYLNGCEIGFYDKEQCYHKIRECERN